MSVLPFVVAAMTLLAPGREHRELGEAIARSVDADEPLFANDADRRRTAALLVAVAFRESSFDATAVGDGGRSFCAFQIHRSAGGSPALLQDADACVRMGLSLLRRSLHMCKAHPIAWYAAGPRGCENERAKRISRDRMNLADYLVTRVHIEGS